MRGPVSRRDALSSQLETHSKCKKETGYEKAYQQEADGDQEQDGNETGFRLLYWNRFGRQEQRRLCFGSARRSGQRVPAADERGGFPGVLRQHSTQPRGGGSRRTVAVGGGGDRKVRARSLRIEHAQSALHPSKR